MKKRIYVIDNVPYFLDSNNEVFEIRVNNKNDLCTLKAFSTEKGLYNLDDIPSELYENDFFIDWSKIEFTGNKNLINKFNTGAQQALKNVGKPDIIVYLDYYENVNLLRQLNEQCIRDNINLLPFIITESSLIIGPYIIPSETSCYECKYQRMVNNDVNFDHLDVLEKIFTSSDHKACSTENINIAQIILNKIIKMIHTRLENHLINSELIINILDLTIKKRPILKWPMCRCKDLKWIY